MPYGLKVSFLKKCNESDSPLANKVKCDQACENRACGLLKFDYFSNFWLS